MAIARALVPAAVALIAHASCTESCPDVCLAASGDLVLEVRAGAGALSDVSAAIGGPQIGAMSCASDQDAFLCTWPASLPVVAGTYALTVAASGFRSTTISATVALEAPTACGCPRATLTPSNVTLDPQ